MTNYHYIADKLCVVDECVTFRLKISQRRDGSKGLSYQCELEVTDRGFFAIPFGEGYGDRDPPWKFIGNKAQRAIINMLKQRYSSLPEEVQIALARTLMT